MGKKEGLYHRIAPIYNLLDWPYEVLLYRKMRKKWIGQLRNQVILEVGVGTGKNLKFYDDSNRVVAIDRSDKMLNQAEKELRKIKHREIQLLYQPQIPWKLPEMDYTVVIATFVMCTMEDPTPVLKEIARCVSTGTKLILFEYAKPSSKLARFFSQLISPMTKFLFGVNFKREPTLSFIGEEWEVVEISKLMGDFMFVAVLRRT